MTISLYNYKEGDEVAITLVGTRCVTSTGAPYLGVNGVAVLNEPAAQHAVDAYRIETVYKPGDMVRSGISSVFILKDDGKTWMCIHSDYGTRIGAEMLTGPDAGCTRVKLVEVST